MCPGVIVFVVMAFPALLQISQIWMSLSTPTHPAFGNLRGDREGGRQCEKKTAISFLLIQSSGTIIIIKGHLMLILYLQGPKTQRSCYKNKLMRSKNTNDEIQMMKYKTRNTK